MRYLITGANGQLGYDLKKELLKRGISQEDVLATDRDMLDITNRENVFDVVSSFEPNVIFHCAAWTAVDKAEDEKDLTNLVNVIGTKNIVDASIEVGAKIIYTSTDYVFDGTKDGLYTPEDDVNPKSVYGLTKYLGEEEVRRNPDYFIARISWVFGSNGNNFIKTMLSLSDKFETLNVVCDQIGSPTYTVDLAKLLVDMSQTDKYGTYHVTNEGFCSWAEFAEYIFEINGKNTKVNKVSTDEYLNIMQTKQAYRPKNSRLDKSKLDENGFERLPNWKDATKRFCLSLKKGGK